MKTLIVIPARYASTRFPGKPLVKLNGVEMLVRVWNIAKFVCEKIQHTQAVVATEDTNNNPIPEFCKEKNIQYVTTSEKCQSGTDRSWEVASRQQQLPEVIINLQGDNPLCPPEFITTVINAFSTYKNAQVITPCTKLSWEELDELREAKKITKHSGTTVTFNADTNTAYWFSKQMIPAIKKEKELREASEESPVFRHIGLYGYRFESLKFFANTPKTNYESLEELEQLRFIEHQIPIHLVQVKYPLGYGKMASGIDSPEDMERAEKLIKLYGEILS